MSVTHHIGLEIAEHSFRFVEMQKQDRHTTILRADILQTVHDYASPLLFDIPFDSGLARDFIRDLATVFHRHTVYASSLSLVLPSMLPLVTMLPVDDAVPRAIQRSQLQWECESLGGHVADTPLTILTYGLERMKKTLAVALPTACVDFLNNTCEHLTLDLTAIDTNHFIMENVVGQLYPHNATGTFAVLGLFTDHCSAGLYHHGEYRGFRQTAVTYKQHFAAQAVQLLENLPGFYSTGQPDHVFVFGSAAGDDVIDALDGILKSTVVRCIPLADTRIPDPLLRSIQDTGESLFDVAASAALLGLA
ncbi:MAG: hypothetical protein IH600_14515 [Bacteroidetes bacterium]|nr:hypothetical protein [Bacteroidota bacterium]